MIDVKYPDAEQKEHSISLICEKTNPEKKNAFAFLIGSYRQIGVKIILKNSFFPYLFSIVVYTIGLVLSLTVCQGAYKDENNFVDVLSVFFFAAPVVMQLSELLYFIYESPAGVLEYRNSYKYTAYQISLLRMPLFSVAAMIVDDVIAVVWCMRHGIGNILAPLGLIACSVLIYSLVNVVFFSRFQRAGFVITAVLWFLVNGVLLTLPAELKTALFLAVPFVVHVAVAALLVVVFARVVERSYLKPVCLITG